MFPWESQPKLRLVPKEVKARDLLPPEIRNLKRGDVVVAKTVPNWVCIAPEGMLGVVFEEYDAYGDKGGPMVRWFNGYACNVYLDYCELAFVA